MRGAIAFALAATLTVSLAGGARAQGAAFPFCSVASGHTHGCIVTSMDGPLASVDDSVASTLEGRACAWNLLALVSSGDMRISTAMRDGGITRVSSVEYSTFELVSWYRVFSRFCTVVRGE